MGLIWPIPVTVVLHLQDVAPVPSLNDLETVVVVEGLRLT